MTSNNSEKWVKTEINLKLKNILSLKNTTSDNMKGKVDLG